MYYVLCFSQILYLFWRLVVSFQFFAIIFRPPDHPLKKISACGWIELMILDVMWSSVASVLLYWWIQNAIESHMSLEIQPQHHGNTIQINVKLFTLITWTSLHISGKWGLLNNVPHYGGLKSVFVVVVCVQNLTLHCVCLEPMYLQLPSSNPHPSLSQPNCLNTYP